VSLGSFGHTGFTGTMAWADPEDDIVYVFLSNRVYPSAANKKLQDLNIRPRIQQVVHDAIDKQGATPMQARSDQR
jgi:CubicO group peptidase (beta-lactamase class C family)